MPALAEAAGQELAAMAAAKMALAAPQAGQLSAAGLLASCLCPCLFELQSRSQKALVADSSTRPLEAMSSQVRLSSRRSPSCLHYLAPSD